MQQACKHWCRIAIAYLKDASNALNIKCNHCNLRHTVCLCHGIKQPVSLLFICWPKVYMSTDDKNRLVSSELGDDNLPCDGTDALCSKHGQTCSLYYPSESTHTNPPVLLIFTHMRGWPFPISVWISPSLPHGSG